ncbi:MAG: hypothetical protein R2784_09100 [Saprospiraceae bacterium]
MSNNTYNKLEDQGWEKMKAMLDAEMPVEGQPKRRVPFWWWTGAAAILVLVASIVLFDTNRNTEEIASQLENEQKISTNNQAEISDNQQPTNKSSYNFFDPNFLR